MSAATLNAPAVVETPVPQPIESVRPSAQPADPLRVAVLPNKRITNDPRVDACALFKVVEPRVAEMAEELKRAMKEAGTKFADGERGRAELRVTSAPGVIDPMRFWSVARGRNVDVPDILKCITVSKSRAEEVLSKKEVAAITTPGSPREPSLICGIPKNDEVPGVYEALLLLADHFAPAGETPPSLKLTHADAGHG
jgi:hypothetical protein